MKRLKRKKRTFKKKKKHGCLVFFALIFLIVAIFLGIKLYNKYSFTNERVVLSDYIGVSGNNVAIYLNDIKITDDDKTYGIFRYNNVYLPLSFINDNINSVFYYDIDTQNILYSLSTETLNFSDDSTFENSAPIFFMESEPYLLIDFVKKYSPIRYSSYVAEEVKRIFIYNIWENEQIAYIRSNENARVAGGNKAPIICSVNKGEEVTILEKYDKWSLVKTETGYIGYIRNHKMDTSRTKMNINNFVEESFSNITYNKKISLAWHQVANKTPRTNFETMIDSVKDTYNIIAPTWFIFNDNDGNMKNNASIEYSEYAKQAGIDLWATVTNITEKNINTKSILSSSAKRKYILNTLLGYAKQYSLSGINIDIEDIPVSCANDYLQFIREFSIICRNNQIISSVCLNIPYEFNSHYNTDELGKICDYVCIMCYNEFHMSSKTSGPNSSISFVKEGINLSKNLIDNNKLIIALPLYTYVWFKNSDGTITAKTLSANNAQDYAEKNQLTKTWDNTTSSYYCTGKVNNKDIEVWLEETKSLSAKLDAVNEANVAGFAFWKVSQEDDAIKNLIKSKY